MWPTRRSRRAGERGAAAGADLGGLGCLGAFSFFFVGAVEVSSAGAAEVVFEETFFSISLLRSAFAMAEVVVSTAEESMLDIEVDLGFVRPTTRGLCWRGGDAGEVASGEVVLIPEEGCDVVAG